MSAPSPIGLLFLAAGPSGLRHLRFMERKSLKRMLALVTPEDPEAEWQPSLLELKPVVDQLDAYFCGTLTRFDLPLDLRGSPFQLAVWRELTRIPYAQTRSYGEIARAIGQPKAPRAVGLANNQNPIALIVPCHRVIGADGNLTGYGGGLPRKRWLLEHERRFAELATRAEPILVASARPAPLPEAIAGCGKSGARRRAARKRPATSARAPR
jgi:methylated-DNA-[protein]-cysteine S-methyltransferase